MTFEEMDRRFPNGFDDAEMTSITADYEKRVATFKMNLRCNPAESPDRDLYEKVVLKASEVYYVSIESPDPAHLLDPEQKKITVDGLPEDPHDFSQFRHLKPKLPAGAFFCRFFVHDWNSFIHIAAAEAELSRVALDKNEKANDR